MKNLLLLIFVAFSVSLSAQSERFKKGGSKADKPTEQSEEPKPKTQASPEKPKSWTDKLIFGGGAGLSFGTNTNIFLAPQVGYQLKDNLVVGAGYMYNYARWRSIWANGSFQNTDFENTVHGPNVFANYSPLEGVFLGAQFEVLNHDAYLYNINTFDFDVENRWTNVLFVQGGFRQQVGKKGMMLLGIRYNLLHDQYSPYGASWAPILLVYF
jgi:hypothetical protein